jgi:Uma2 family endonuclease
VLRAHDQLGRLCELVEGVLVEKAMGLVESVLACQLGCYLCNYMDQHPLGIMTGSDGMVKITTGLVRIPDVAFFSWDHLPGRVVPTEPIPQVPIDLAVEVLSKTNSRREMKQKLGDYIAAGARLVWYIDPRKRTARI